MCGLIVRLEETIDYTLARAGNLGEGALLADVEVEPVVRGVARRDFGVEGHDVLQDLAFDVFDG